MPTMDINSLPNDPAALKALLIQQAGQLQVQTKQLNTQVDQLEVIGKHL